MPVHEKPSSVMMLGFMGAACLALMVITIYTHYQTEAYNAWKDLVGCCGTILNKICYPFRLLLTGLSYVTRRIKDRMGPLVVPVVHGDESERIPLMQRPILSIENDQLAIKALQAALDAGKPLSHEYRVIIVGS